MRCAILLVLTAAAGLAEPRVDNVLVKMVPPGATSLVGAHLDQLRNSALYSKLMDQAKLRDFDRFQQETGFDPRRDVREILLATTPKGTALLARGTFHLNAESTKKMKLVRHGEYSIWTSGESGFCILDDTLAVAGQAQMIAAVLDEWKSGNHLGAQPLLARVRASNPASQLWGVSSGVSGFLTDRIPNAGNGIDFGKILRGLEDSWFEADFTSGLKATVHGTTASEQDAVSLRDTARGLVGFGRLNVPEDQPQMLKLWDGITTEQQSKAVTIRADIPQNLVDNLTAMLSANAGPGSARDKSGAGRRDRPKR